MKFSQPNSVQSLFLGGIDHPEAFLERLGLRNTNPIAELHKCAEEHVLLPLQFSSHA